MRSEWRVVAYGAGIIPDLVKGRKKLRTPCVIETSILPPYPGVLRKRHRVFLMISFQVK